MIGQVEPIRLTIDGREVSVPPGTTVWEAARSAGIEVPVLCHDPELRPVGVCRLCVVEVEGSRVLAPSCTRACEAGMKVRTRSEAVEKSRRMLTELLLADHPSPCTRQRITADCALEALGARYGIERPRFAARAIEDGLDDSSAVIAVDHRACILCDRCIRACDEVQVNLVIGRSRKGHETRISFDREAPMGRSTCVSCGECMSVCPTGALTDKLLAREPAWPAASSVRTVDSACPYCGVGCSLTFHVDAERNRIVRATGRPDGHANRGRLCVKGRYGWDYTGHPERLTVPLIRKQGVAKNPDGHSDPMSQFREATWDEALDLSARTFLRVRGESGPGALAGFGSAKCSNEDNYLFQKLVRAVFGTNNVDHCTRLCHASSVAALMETIGSGAVSNQFGDVALADACLIVGSNTTDNHPVAATFIKQAARRGTTLIVLDPREVDIARHARHYVRFRSGTDVALLNSMMQVIIEEGLADARFVEERTTGFEALREVVSRYRPEVASRITGVPASKIREVARAYGRAKSAITFWGMGISQHTTGTDNARALIALCLLTGNVGRPGTGLHPLRGQNNVQGASDAGLIPFVYTDYQKVSDPAAREKFERAWGVALDPVPGLTVVEIMAAVLAGKIRAMFMMGENPFLSDPNINKVKKALAHLGFLAVQDIFLTETAEFADVVLPATSFAEKDGTYTNTDRQVQRARKAIDPPGRARADWEIVCDLSTRMGYPMRYASPKEIFDELRALSPSYAGITYERLEEGGILWPVPHEGHPGTSVIFEKDFPIGRGRFVPAHFADPKELPDDEYPFVLNTGRMLQHWHTGTMTRRAKALDEIAPEAWCEINPADVDRLGARDGEFVQVSSRRGSIRLRVRASGKSAPGTVFIPFHFKEAAANALTIDALDPIAKIPEFKFCAVKVEIAPPGATPEASGAISD